MALELGQGQKFRILLQYDQTRHEPEDFETAVDNGFISQFVCFVQLKLEKYKNKGNCFAGQKPERMFGHRRKSSEKSRILCAILLTLHNEALFVSIDKAIHFLIMIQSDIVLLLYWALEKTSCINVSH